MNDAGAIVRVIERIAELARPGRNFVWLKNLVLFVGPQIREGVAIDVLHRNAGRALVLHKVVNPHDVGMGQLETAACLALEVV